MIFSILACNNYGKPQSGILNFSSDTVFFDTIFTQVGSTTKKFKVYNATSEPLLIDNIILSGGNNSKFRLNIDGYEQNSVEDIKIDAEDSIYIFVEVTIDPAKDDIVEQDSLIFVSGDNTQKILLLAVGKDVNLIKGKMVNTQTWTSEKPYLIYNSVMVDTLQTLTIDAGVEVYSHRNSYIFVKGSLIANGTKESPIYFRGDRIDDPWYENKPGQWGGIYFMQGSFGNYLNYIQLKEGFYGIAVDSSININEPTVFINNSIIQHCSYAGVLGVYTNFTIINSIIADCGVYNIALFMSGLCNLFNCTIQNDYAYSPRNSPSVALKNYYTDDEYVNHYTGDISAYFANCIINGNQTNEFVADAYDSQSISLLFQNCLLKLDDSTNNLNSPIFENCVFNPDSLYIKQAEFDYHLRPESQARDKGSDDVINANLIWLNYDIDGNDRLFDNQSDIGAYELLE